MTADAAEATTTKLKRCAAAAAMCAVGLAALLVVSCDYSHFDQQPDGASFHRNLRRFHGIFNEQYWKINKERAVKWRTDYERLCNNTASTEAMLIAKLGHVTKPSMIKEGTHEDNLIIKPCKYVMLDFGANVGDSLQKFISAGIPRCPDKVKMTPRYDGLTGAANHTFKHGRNKLVAWTWLRMSDMTSTLPAGSTYSLAPEDYCYFGIEGNPAFTDQLKTLERSVMRMDPRPVRRAHFFTESVGAGADGKTVLYLDTVNTAKNAWGSSLLANHIDVKKSAEQNGGNLVEAKVQGITLAKMLRDTVLPEKGSHVMIKMDIEGGENIVMEAAADSGVVCDFISKGVKIDMIMELHNDKITGPRANEDFDKAKKKLMKCGLNLYQVKDADR